jgi:hypothetical protein
MRRGRVKEGKEDVALNIIPVCFCFGFCLVFCFCLLVLVCFILFWICFVCLSFCLFIIFCFCFPLFYLTYYLFKVHVLRSPPQKLSTATMDCICLLLFPTTATCKTSPGYVANKKEIEGMVRDEDREKYTILCISKWGGRKKKKREKKKHSLII